MDGLRSVISGLLGRGVAGHALAPDVTADEGLATPAADAEQTTLEENADAVTSADLEQPPVSGSADVGAGVDDGASAAVVDAPETAAAADADAANAERSRVAAVFASEHAKGREAHAARMLQTAMSADEIIGLLADLPKADAAGEVLRTLASQQNPNLGAGTETTSNEDAQSIWGKAIAVVSPRRAA